MEIKVEVKIVLLLMHQVGLGFAAHKNNVYYQCLKQARIGGDFFSQIK